MAQARIYHQLPTAVVPEHALCDVRSVGMLDILASMPARSSVANAAHATPWNALATEAGEKCGLYVPLNPYPIPDPSGIVVVAHSLV